jgi:methyl coenzyme M reductase gamma subunit
MLRNFHIIRSFARKSYKSSKSTPSNQPQFTEDNTQGIDQIDKQLSKIQQTRRTIKKFSERNKERFTQKELKVMNLSFDQVTDDISNGTIDVRSFEAERIKRKLSQNFNAYEYESRLRNRLENLMLEIGDNIQFPWNFNADFEREEVKNLDTVYRIDNILERGDLEARVKQFFRGVIERDFTRVKDVSEKHMVKRVK